MLGGVIADRWGWKAAFGVVGFPGLVLALLYLLVRDYQHRGADAAGCEAARQSLGVASAHIVQVLTRSRTMLWVCIGGAGAADRRLGGVGLAAELPRTAAQGITPAGARRSKASLVVLCRRRRRRGLGRGGRPRRQASRPRRQAAHWWRCCAWPRCVVICFAFGAPRLGHRVVGAGPVRADRARRLPDDLHRRPGGGDA